MLLLDISSLMRDGKLMEMSQVGKEEASDSQMKTATEEGYSAADGGTESQWVTFLLAGEEYGVPISQIQEIDRLSKITKVPGAPSFVEGVTNLRGEVISVIDTRQRFNWK